MLPQAPEPGEPLNWNTITDEELKAMILHHVEQRIPVTCNPDLEGRILTLLPSLGLTHRVDNHDSEAFDSRSIYIMPTPPWQYVKHYIFPRA